MKIFFCVWVIAFVYTGAAAQSNPILDSLLRIIPHTKKDTHLVQLYYDIGFQYELNDVKTAAQYYNKAKKLSQVLGWKKGLIKYAFNYTQILNAKGDFDASLELNKESIRLSQELKDNVLITKSYANTGNVFLERDQYDSAVYYYEIAKKYAAGDGYLSARVADLMTIVYPHLRRYEEAVQQGEAALAYFRQVDDPMSLSTTAFNLGLAYMNVDISKAQQLMIEALHLSRQIGYDQLRLKILNALIAPYFAENKSTDPAVQKYAVEALSIAKNQDDLTGIGIAYRSLGIHYLFKREYEKSLHYLDSSLSVLQSKDFPSEIQKTLFNKGLLLYAMGKLEEGRKVLDAADSQQDAVVNSEMRKQVLTLEKRFESEKKEAQIKLQKAVIRQKNLLNYILAGGSIGLISILLLGYRNYQHKRKLQHQKINELETEKQLLATQSLLKGQEDERSRLAKDLHDGLGGMLSGVKLQLGAMKGNMILTEENLTIFNSALDKLDQSISEMRRVAHNMMPEALIQVGLEQALRDYCDSLSYKQNFSIQCVFRGMEQRLDRSIELIIYRMVQELVNNAVKYSESDIILVQLIRHDANRLDITVEDNGKGFNTNEIKKDSTGLRNIASRVEYLNGKMDIQSTLGKGTSVYIECEITPHG